MIQIRKALDRTFSNIKPYLREAFLSDFKLVSISPQPEWLHFATCKTINSPELLFKAGNHGSNRLKSRCTGQYCTHPLVHPSSHPPRLGPSVCALAYSIGMPPFPTSPALCATLGPPNNPFRLIACLYSLPPSPTPNRNSSQAARMALYWRSSSRSRNKRSRCMVSWAAR